MDTSIFQRSDEWLRPNDVIVSVPAKSGTHWTMYTLNMLRSRGHPPPFDDIYTETPWPEFVYYPGQPLNERIEYVRNLSSKFPFSIYKSHYAPPDFPVRDDVRYVVMIRNTYDAIASLKGFYASFSPSFKTLWGGFPPNANQSPEYWEHFVLEDGGDGQSFASTFMQPLIGWWPYRHNKNVLIMHYSDRILDDRPQLRRLAEFLQLNLTEEELALVAENVSYEVMKKSEHLVEMMHLLDEFKKRGKVPLDAQVLDATIDSPMLQAGPKRSGKKECSERMRNRIQTMLLERFGPAVSNWIENSGQLPINEELPWLLRDKK